MRSPVALKISPRKARRAANRQKKAERRAERAQAFDVERPRVSLKELHHEHSGLLIAQLSDLHIGAGVPDSRVLAAVDLVNAEKPDLVVLTGDFVTSPADPIERVGALLKGLRGHVFAVLGNHDHWSGAATVTRALESAGITVLQNEHTVLELRHQAFTIVGVDDSRTRHDDVEKAFKGVKGNSHLVLTHAPSCARKLPAQRDLVCLSGHTHGGHINLPTLTWGAYSLAGERWYRGHHYVRGNQLYVNRGLGFGRGTKLPRLRSEPEVTLLTLARHP